MKMLATLAALMLGTTAAVAGPFGLPNHQPDGFRDTGCDASAQKPITNANGDVLYWNGSCPSVGGGSNGDIVAAIVAQMRADREEATPDEEAPVDVALD